MALNYLLDTNICIYIIKKHPISVAHKFEQVTVGEVGMSIVTYGELLYGAYKSQYKKKSLAILEELSSFIVPLPMSTHVSKYYGEIRSQLEQQGKIIGNNDLWIAAHTIALDVKLVTNNVKEFSRIPQLSIENWAEETL